MTDDLVKRLRAVGGFDPAAELCSEAADRIHKLELDLHFQKLQQVEWACYACMEKSAVATARIEKLEAALNKILQKCVYARREKWCSCLDCNCVIAGAALEGNKND